MQHRVISKVSGSALIVIGIVDAVINTANMVSISPLPLEIAAMGILGVAIVFFKIEARLAGNKFLWFVAACITFWNFLQFFLTIVASGLTPLPDTQIKVENPIVLEAKAQYEKAKEALASIDAKQSTTDANHRTYSNDLAAQRKDAVAQQEAAFSRWQSLSASVSAEGKQFGLDVFGKIPQLVSRIGRTSWVESCAILIAIIMGIAIGFFIEAFMVHAANESLKKQEDTKDEPAIEHSTASANAQPDSTGARRVPGDEREEPASGDTARDDSTDRGIGDRPERSGKTITERMYVGAAWPKGSRRIRLPAEVAKEKGWEETQCNELHSTVFGTLEFYDNPEHLYPKVSRDQFLRSRRAAV